MRTGTSNLFCKNLHLFGDTHSEKNRIQEKPGKSINGENRLKHIPGQKELFLVHNRFFALQLQNLLFLAWSVTESLQLDDDDQNERSRPQRIFQNRLSQQNKNVSNVFTVQCGGSRTF